MENEIKNQKQDNKKSKIKDFFKGYGLSVLAIGLSSYAIYAVSNLENTIESFLGNHTQRQISVIKKELNNVKNKIKTRENTIQQLKTKISEEDKKIDFIAKKINSKIEVKRDNLIFSKTLENALKSLNLNNNYSTSNKMNNRNGKSVINLNEEFKKAKKITKKIIRPKKIHINAPKVIYIKKISLINGNVYANLDDNIILGKNSIYKNSFQVEKIDYKTNIITFKNINKKSYEYNKHYKASLVIKTDSFFENTNESNNENSASSNNNQQSNGDNGVVVLH
jgi:hypothetical protein